MPFMYYDVEYQTPGLITIHTQTIINLTQSSSSNINRLLSFKFIFKRTLDKNLIPYIFFLCYPISDLFIKHSFSIQLYANSLTPSGQAKDSILWRRKEVFARKSRRKRVKCRQNQLLLLGNTENFRLSARCPPFRGSYLYRILFFLYKICTIQKNKSII